MSQEQRDGEQPWVLAGGLAGHTADEHVEVVADVEFFEQRVQQPSRQHKAARAFGKCTKVIEAALLSPVVNLGALGRPGRLLWARASSVCGSVAHGRHLRQSARLWERRRPPARRLSRGAGEGRGVCRRPLCVEGAAGLRPSGK